MIILGADAQGLFLFDRRLYPTSFVVHGVLRFWRMESFRGTRRGPVLFLVMFFVFASIVLAKAPARQKCHVCFFTLFEWYFKKMLHLFRSESSNSCSIC